METLAADVRKWFESKSKKQKLFISLMAFSLLATGALFSLTGYTSSVAEDPLGSSPFYFLSAFVKLIVVLLLIVGCSIVFRRWFQIGPNNKVTREMRLVETIRLSPKQALHLIVIGDQKLLIGATDQNVSLITSIENGSIPVMAEHSQRGLDFGSIIRSFDQDYSTEGVQEESKDQS